LEYQDKNNTQSKKYLEISESPIGFVKIHQSLITEAKVNLHLAQGLQTVVGRQGDYLLIPDFLPVMYNTFGTDKDRQKHLIIGTLGVNQKS